MTAKNIHQRIHAAMADVDYIQKDRKPGMNYTIVSHDAVTAKVRPVLHKHGIVYYPVALDSEQDGNRTQVRLRVRFANVDEPTDFIDVPSLGYGIDPQDKGPGKAISYAVKYALLKTLGLETGDDPDTESVTHEPAPKKGKPTANAAAPNNSVTDWNIIANDLIEDACKLRTVAAVNALLRDRNDQFRNMPADIQERVKLAVGKHRESLGLPAMAAG